jgi:hypothetical protein
LGSPSSPSSAAIGFSPRRTTAPPGRERAVDRQPVDERSHPATPVRSLRPDEEAHRELVVGPEVSVDVADERERANRLPAQRFGNVEPGVRDERARNVGPHEEHRRDGRSVADLDRHSDPLALDQVCRRVSAASPGRAAHASRGRWTSARARRRVHTMQLGEDVSGSRGSGSRTGSQRPIATAGSRRQGPRPRPSASWPDASGSTS